MKAILLAAGRGTRIARNVGIVPKSTLPVNGEPLIHRSVKMLQGKGIECIVCTGYEEQQVMDALGDCERVKYYTNPFYDVTNSIASLWMAREELNDDIILLNADVFFSEKILNMIINDSRDPVMAIDKSRTIEGDYFFYTSLDGKIEKYGKGLPIEQRNCEYVGMAKVCKEFLPKFNKRLNELIHQQKHNVWWENVLYSFTDTNQEAIYTVDVDGKFWAEIDYFDDYERILDYVARHDK